MLGRGRAAQRKSHAAEDSVAATPDADNRAGMPAATQVSGKAQPLTQIAAHQVELEWNADVLLARDRRGQGKGRHVAAYGLNAGELAGTIGARHLQPARPENQ